MNNKGQGLKLITSNYRSRFGEIDLIMQDGESLVFIEVWLRKSKAFGGADESIAASKQHKIVITAEYDLQQHGSQECRFDAIFMNKADAQNITWIKNAIEA